VSSTVLREPIRPSIGAQARGTTRRIVFFVLLLIAALGYSEFYTSYARILILAFLLPLADAVRTRFARIRAETILLLFLYVQIAAVLFRLYAHGGLTPDRIGYLVLFPLSLAGAYAVGRKLSHDELSGMLLVLLTLLLAVGLYQVFSPTYVTGRVEDGEWLRIEGVPWFARRVSSFSGNANVLGTLTAFILLFNLFSSNATIRRLTTVFAFVCIVLLAKSRSATLVAIAAGMMYLIYRKKYVTAAIIIVVLVAAVIALLPLIQGDATLGALLRFREGDWGVALYTARILVDVDALRIWLDHYFWFGVGFDAETYALTKYDAFAAYTESIYVKIPLELGFSGVAIILTLLLGSFSRLWRRANARGLGGLFLAFVATFAIMAVMETAPMMPSAMLPIAIMFGTLTSDEDGGAVASS
jgi:hypothetical protein